MQERHTWLAFFRAYFRVLLFSVLWFHALLALAFATDTVGGPTTDAWRGKAYLGLAALPLTHAVSICLLSQHAAQQLRYNKLDSLVMI